MRTLTTADPGHGDAAPWTIHGRPTQTPLAPTAHPGSGARLQGIGGGTGGTQCSPLLNRTPGWPGAQGEPVTIPAQNATSPGGPGGLNSRTNPVSWPG